MEGFCNKLARTIIPLFSFSLVWGSFNAAQAEYNPFNDRRLVLQNVSYDTHHHREIYYFRIRQSSDTAEIYESIFDDFLDVCSDVAGGIVDTVGAVAGIAGTVAGLAAGAAASPIVYVATGGDCSPAECAGGAAILVGATCAAPFGALSDAIKGDK